MPIDRTDDDSLDIKINADASEATAGFDTAASNVSANVRKIVQAQVELKAATKEARDIFKQYGSDVNTASQLAADAITRQARASNDLAAAKRALKAEQREDIAVTEEESETVRRLQEEIDKLRLKLEEMGSASRVSFSNARSGATGLFSEMDLRGNRAMSSFLAQSEALGPVLSAAFSTIAIVGFIELAIQAGRAIYTWYQNTILLRQANEDLDNVLQKIKDFANNSADRGAEAVDRAFARTHNAFEIAKRDKEEFEKKPVDLSKMLDDKKFKELPNEIKQVFEPLKSPIQPTAFYNVIDQIENKLRELADQKKKLDDQVQAASSQIVGLGAPAQLPSPRTQSMTDAQIKAARELSEDLHQIGVARQQQDFDLDEAVLEGKKTVDQQSVQDAKQAAQLTMQEWRLAASQIKASFGPDQVGANQALLDFWGTKLPQAARMGSVAQREVLTAETEAHKALQGEMLSDEQKQVDTAAAATKAGSLQRIQIYQEELARLQALGLQNLSIYQHVQEQLTAATREGTDKEDTIELAKYQVMVASTRQGTQERVHAAEEYVSKAKQLYGEDSREYERALESKAVAERDFHRQVLSMREEEIDFELSHQKSLEKIQEVGLQARTSLGLISEKQELAQLRDFHQQEYEADRQALENKLKLLEEDPESSPATHERLLNQIKKLDDQYHVTQAQDEAKSLNQRLQKIKQFFDQVNQNIKTSINGWLQGTQTFGQAMLKIWQSITGAIIEDIISIGLKFIETHLIMAAVAKLFNINIKKDDDPKEQAKKRVAANTVANIQMILSDAALGAAAAYASTSAIPIVGPALAPGVAEATFKRIASYAPMAAFHRGGLSDFEQTAVLDREEMVLDPSLSRGIQNMIAAGGAGGGHTFTIAPQFVLQGFDGKSVKQMFHEHRSAMADEITSLVKERVLRMPRA